MGAEGFDYKSASEIMDEIASLTPIYGGISFERIEDVGLQWPCPNKDHKGTKFLHTNRFSRKNGLGKFFPLTYKASIELPDKEYPLLLTTDRSLYHYHTSTMTRRVEGLEIIDGEELLNVNIVDAEKMGLADGDIVGVKIEKG